MASEQADWFIRHVPRVAGALPPVIDVEYNGQSSCKRRMSPEKRREKMQVFMDRLEAHYGQRPIIYTAPDFYRDNLRGHFQNYPFWLRAVAQHPSKVYPGRNFVFWQYSGSGLSQGVKGRIDLNVFNGSEAQWRRGPAAKRWWRRSRLPCFHRNSGRKTGSHFSWNCSSQTYAARRSWRPSAISSVSLAQKASRSPGWRLVTRPWSVTTSESSHLPPALMTSVLIDL